MINSIIEGLYNFVFDMVGFYTQPISDMITNNFPDFATAISNVTSFFNSLSSVLAWFVFLIPKPFTILMLTVFVGFAISTFPALVQFEVSGKLLNLVKRIWPFGGK